MEYQKEAHSFLINKGIKSISETFNALTIEQWLSEFAEQQVKKLTIPAVIKSVCPLCDGKGRRVFHNCNPPIDEVCPACKGQTVL